MKEALKLALEALEPLVSLSIEPEDLAGIYKAIAAIKEALAQPEEQQSWVSLTKEEINSALSKYQNWYEFAAHLENILKEKNQ